jgi:catalase-peroxidase
MANEAKCPFAHSPNPSAVAGSRGNRNWWPQQLNLAILHQQSGRSDPMGETFDYAA